MAYRTSLTGPFVWTLFSNASMDLFPDNSPSYFRTAIQPPIRMEGEWQVGLKEIVLPPTWRNITTKDNIIRLDVQIDERDAPKLPSPTPEANPEIDVHKLDDHILDETNEKVETYGRDNVLDDTALVPVSNITEPPPDVGFDIPPNCYTANGMRGNKSVVQLFKRYRIVIPVGFYNTFDELLYAINHAAEETCGEHILHPLLKYDKFMRRVRYNYHTYDASSSRARPDVVALHFEPDSAIPFLLGLQIHCGVQNVGGYRFRTCGTTEPNMIGDVNSLMVYSNIVASQPVGDTYAKLLAAIPMPEFAHGGRIIRRKMTNPDFVDLRLHSLDRVEIDIRTDFGTRPEFEHGRALVRLEFRPKP
jgi:hypothetical protein